MSSVETVLLSLLVLDAIALTVLVLLQQGKGADVGAAFGSGSSNTMFGSLGTTSFLTKATAWLAVGFFVIAFSLAYTAKQRAEQANNLGIPVVGDAPVQELTESQESVNSPKAVVAPMQSDVPRIDAEESTSDDIPEL